MDCVYQLCEVIILFVLIFRMLLMLPITLAVLTVRQWLYPEDNIYSTDDDSEIVQIPEQNGEAPLKTKEQKQEGYKISQGSKLEIEVMRNIQKKDLEVEEFYPDDAMDECSYMMKRDIDRIKEKKRKRRLIKNEHNKLKKQALKEEEESRKTEEEKVKEKGEQAIALKMTEENKRRKKREKKKRNLRNREEREIVLSE